MCHPSQDLPFEHPSIFYKQQLSFCRAVTVPECHRWGEELWLHPMGSTWCGRAEQTLLGQQESTPAQLQHLPCAPADSRYPHGSRCWMARGAHAAAIGAHSTFWRWSLPWQES